MCSICGDDNNDSECPFVLCFLVECVRSMLWHSAGQSGVSGVSCEKVCHIQTEMWSQTMGVAQQMAMMMTDSHLVTSSSHNE